MGAGDGARAAPRGANPWPHEQYCCGHQRVGYAPASPKTVYLGVVPQGLHDSKVLLIVVCTGRSLMQPSWLQ